jgi:hypothetical protein
MMVLVAKEMFAHILWNSYGLDTLDLQGFAIIFLSQMTITSTCERN